ncbi:MAG: PD-(D/E)XK nuclease family protein [Gammaproteobacteria bacterium]|nr:PD-(D/E)XK nuclease family protein [Gammaproteobacteria bacterium]
MITDLDDIFRHYKNDETVLTVNQRLSRFIQSEYGQYQLKNSKQSWPTPRILPWTSWAQATWDQISLLQLAEGRPRILASVEEKWIWKEIVDSWISHSGVAILNSAPLCKLAADTWNLVRQWGIGLDQIQQYREVDGLRFVEWAQQFSSYCDNNGVIDSASVQVSLLSLLDNTDVASITSKVYLMGFDELTPVQNKIIEKMNRSGVNVAHVQVKRGADEVRVIPLASEDEEIKKACAWAKQIHQDNPNSRIGIVSTNLSSTKEKLFTEFDRQFDSDRKLTVIDTRERVFNLSGAESLSRIPLVNDIFLLFSLLSKEFSSEVFFSLSASPYFADNHKAWISDLEYVNLFRRHLATKTDLQKIKTVYDQLNLSDKVSENGFVSLLDKLIALKKRCSRTQLLAEWKELIKTILLEVKWPGSRVFSSDEYQAINTFLDVLEQLPRYEMIRNSCPFEVAVSALNDICEDTLFKPQQGEANVQILGVLEAAGQSFDHLWLMGMHNLAWPSSPNPNTLLPLTLQRSLGLPHSSTEREYEFSKRLTQRLLEESGSVLISYPQSDGNQQLESSELIRQYQTLDVYDLSLVTERVHTEVKMESVPQRAVPIPEPECGVRGGSGFLREQSACPFRAFVKYRLGVAADEELALGLVPMDKGNMVHQTLQDFWTEVRNSETLQTMEEKDLDEKLGHIIEHVLSRFSQLNTKLSLERYRNLEKRRLVRLCKEWLLLEKTRPEFTVLACEEARAIELQGIPINIKIDRLDRLADGSILVIDYKTGNVSPKWEETRMPEPQLPLYACSVENAKAVAFGVVKTGAIGFKGLCDSPIKIKGLKAKKEAGEWEDQLRSWGQSLAELMDEIKNGLVDIQPATYPGTCQRCELPSACRLFERQKQSSDAL